MFNRVDARKSYTATQILASARLHSSIKHASGFTRIKSQIALQITNSFKVKHLQNEVTRIYF